MAQEDEAAKATDNTATDTADAAAEDAEAQAMLAAATTDDVAGDGKDDAKSDVPPEVKTALRKANKEAETLRLKLKEYEDRDKSEQQKALERAEAAEKRAADLERQVWQREAAAKAKLPAAMAARLSGSNLEEIEADAQALAESLKGLNPGPGDAGQGTRKDAGGTDVESMSTEDFAKQFSRHK